MPREGVLVMAWCKLTDGRRVESSVGIGQRSDQTGSKLIQLLWQIFTSNHLPVPALPRRLGGRIWWPELAPPVR